MIRRLNSRAAFWLPISKRLNYNCMTKCLTLTSNPTTTIQLLIVTRSSPYGITSPYIHTVYAVQINSP